MTKSLLLIAKKSDFYLQLSNGLKAKGFDVEQLQDIFQAISSMSSKTFNVVVFAEPPEEKDCHRFFWSFYDRPLGTVVPLIWLGQESSFQHQLPLSNVLDQYFCEKEIKVGDLLRFILVTDQMNEKNEKKGNLSVVKAGRVLAACAATKYSGALICEDGADRIAVYFKSGDVEMVTTNDPEGSLGQYLSEKKILSYEQLKQLHLRGEEDDRMLGQRLIDRGLISNEIFNELLVDHMKERLNGLIAWEKGNYTLLKASHLEQLQGQVSLSVTELLSESIRYRFSDQLVEQLIGIDNNNGYPIISSDRQEALTALKLGRSEKDILLLSNGQLDLARIEKTVAQEPQTFRRNLLLLLSANLLKIEKEPRANIAKEEAPENKQEEKKVKEVKKEEKKIPATEPEPKAKTEIKKPSVDIGQAIAAEIKEDDSLKEEAYSLVPVAAAKEIRQKGNKLPSPEYSTKSSSIPLKLAIITSLLLIGALFLTMRIFNVPVRDSAKKELARLRMKNNKFAKIEIIKEQPLREIVISEKKVISETVPQAVATIKPKRVIKAKKAKKVIKKKRAKANISKLLKKSRALVDNGQFKMAEKVLDKIFSQDGNNLKALELMAKIFFLTGRFERAKNVYQQVVQRDQANVEGHLRLGSIYQMQNNKQLAKKHYMTFLRYASNHHPFVSEVRNILAELK